MSIFFPWEQTMKDGQKISFRTEIQTNTRGVIDWLIGVLTAWLECFE